ncbi:MAG TPA: 1-deoxy-D-xylulose-5-phosphate synthase [Acidimicrobiales bacterium]|nr:1-deoxy-D-xylulose-5-phosphate synthase [Acidimicrobiales bacterium]
MTALHPRLASPDPTWATGSEVRSDLSNRDLGAPPSGTLSGLSPSAIRQLDLSELERLAADIRSFLIGAVAANGGHLGSNLGVVELTLAVHRVFDSPRDRIIWDTGHQTYVHKVVTGRADDFVRLRRRAGLSGYANRAESPHDLVENSHASTALSYAYGLARARELRGEQHHVLAVVGDGALTGGLSYEALSNIGLHGAGLVIVLNDNGRSYAPTVSRLTTAGAPTLPSNAPKDFFESLGISYEGPVDGHDLEALEGSLRRAATAARPVVVHVHTVKGRGYLPAEQDEEKCLHDIGPFDPATGKRVGSLSPRRSYTHAFEAALLRQAMRHPELVAITAAMPGPCGLLEFARRFPERFIDVGIAEQHAVTTASGLAMEGLRPVVTLYSTFLNRAWDQLYYDVGLHRLPVIFCIDRAGITGDDGPSHNGVLDLALLTKVPGMTVLAPSSYEEVEVMLAQALEITSGPVAIRWPKTEARHSALTGHGCLARRVRQGDRVCLLGLGKMVDACERAARILHRDGIEATVWDIRVAAPLDRLMLEDALGHPVVMTVEDGVAEGGVGGSIAEALRVMAGVGPLPLLLARGLPVAYFEPGKPDEILARLGLDENELAATLRGLCS